MFNWMFHWNKCKFEVKMKNIFKSICAHQFKTKTKKPLESSDPKKKCDDSQMWRDILAYWILGLSTEFGYVVIISAAHDILHGFGQSETVIFFCTKSQKVWKTNEVIF